MKIRIGSRGSKLAVTQAEWVGQKLKEMNKGLELSFVQIVTTGDKQTDSALQETRTKGVFVKEIEDALLKNEIDLAVHSLKDVPQELPAGLVLGPFPVREDPRDVLISRFGEYVHELPRGSIIGTGSPRRQAQIAHKHAKRGYKIEPIRGNIDTRLKKLKEGKYDAIILAYAGLKRIGLESEVTQILEPEELLPAACQGCLGLELRHNDNQTLGLIETIKDSNSDVAARAERAFLQGLGGNCYVPVGVYSKITDGIIAMKALLLDPTGKKAVDAEQEGPWDAPELVGGQLAERLLYNGGSEIMVEKTPSAS